MFPFKDSPTITVGCSKILTLNTNFEAVEQVQKNLTSIKADQVSMKKEFKSEVSLTNTVGNKWDSSIKPQLEVFKKRIRTNESCN